ncbi:MAG: LPS-assembly protein LptD [Rhizobiales bacterium]|nr:LPS-assembly protein LptD [Hyphomicrobiales bacterium]
MKRRHTALVGTFVCAALLGGTLLPERASAQVPTPAWVGVPTGVPRGGTTKLGKKRDPNAQMLVDAAEIRYDYRSERVIAVGNVQIHYSGATLEADTVTYDQRSKRLYAEGNVRLTEADGKIINANRLELTEDFRDGFVDSLHVETSDKLRMAAARAEVQTPEGTDNRLTVFQSGVYTACQPCMDEPQKPPKWQVKAARIIHDENEKTIYFEDARFEIFGFPIAYLPYFSTPDPTVKRKSGFLQPRVLNGTYYGFGIQPVYFWNLAPNYDLTFSPMYTTKQGLLGQVEWRHRLMDGAYTIRASGIFQQDRAAFVGTTGDREFRGAVETKGDFRLSKNWFYGWDASLFTDNSYAPQYKMTRQGTEAISQAYLFGRGNYSYFDARALHFYGLSALDAQKQLPFVHPLIDYKYKFADPVFGGELSYNFNFTSLTRQQTDYDPISTAAASTFSQNGVTFSDGKNVCDSTDPAAIKTRANCILRGIDGTYTRASAEVQWRRSITDPFGQIFTPFASLRADVATATINSDASTANFINAGERNMARVMPAVGMEYRYPFISTHSWGSQIIEPTVQVIARPNESQIGKMPNEDSQSLLFDDVNLLAINKFAGWDRVEGGGRANVALQYSAHFNGAGYFNALFGQSFQLFGQNSYAVADMANTGVQSGLETPRSDYVGRVTYQPNSIYTLTSRFRFDEQTFATRRLEFEGRVTFDRWNASLTYGQYDEQQYVGLLLPREGIMPAVNLKLTQNWTVSASALYSLDQGRLNTATVGVGYVDDCWALNLYYTSNYGYSGDIVPNKIVMLQLSLRSLGGTAFSRTVGGPGGSTGGLF